VEQHSACTAKTETVHNILENHVLAHAKIVEILDFKISKFKTRVLILIKQSLILNLIFLQSIKYTAS